MEIKLKKPSEIKSFKEDKVTSFLFLEAKMSVFVKKLLSLAA